MFQYKFANAIKQRKPYYYPMNGILNSEAKVEYSVYLYGKMNSCKGQNNFSDLVPSNAAVESVLNNGFYSFEQLNPMTASYFSDKAVLISIEKSYIEKTGLNALGTGSICTPTVAFLN